MDFPGGSDGKNPLVNAGDAGSVPGLGRYPGEGNGDPLQYSGLETSMDSIVHGVAKSWTRLSNLNFTFTPPSNSANMSNAFTGLEFGGGKG